MFKEKLLKFIEKDNSGFSFVEIERFAEKEGIQPKGDITISSGQITYWSGLSKELKEVIVELYNEAKIYYKPTSLLVYVADQYALNLPIAEEKTEYEKEHWLPVMIVSGRYKK